MSAVVAVDVAVVLALLLAVDDAVELAVVYWQLRKVPASYAASAALIIAAVYWQSRACSVF